MPDAWDKGLPGFMHAWDLTRDARAKNGKIPGFEQRAAADQTEFLARLMHKFNSEMAAYLRDELHCKQLINANNWRTADLAMTQDAEYWADCGQRGDRTQLLHRRLPQGRQRRLADPARATTIPTCR